MLFIMLKYWKYPEGTTEILLNELRYIQSMENESAIEIMFMIHC